MDSEVLDHREHLEQMRQAYREALEDIEERIAEFDTALEKGDNRGRQEPKEPDPQDQVTRERASRAPRA
jgi:HPt (histidine-containing phosphotransfer) domain-containing protein